MATEYPEQMTTYTLPKIHIDPAIEREVGLVAKALAIMHGIPETATNFYPAAREVVKERENLRRVGYWGAQH